MLGGRGGGGGGEVGDDNVEGRCARANLPGWDCWLKQLCANSDPPRCASRLYPNFVMIFRIKQRGDGLSLISTNCRRDCCVDSGELIIWKKEVDDQDDVIISINHC